MIAARLIFILVFAVAFDAGTPLAPPVAAAVEWDEEEEATAAHRERKEQRAPAEVRVAPARPAAPARAAGLRVRRARPSSPPQWTIVLARAHPPAPALASSAEDH
jgi:hypothetical protein